MVSFTTKLISAALALSVCVAALPAPVASQGQLQPRVSLDLEPKASLDVRTSVNGESNSYSVVVAPVITPELLDNLSVDALNDLTVALAGLGTNVINEKAKRDDINVSPNVSPEVLNNVSLSNILNDLFLGLAATGTNVKKVNSSRRQKKRTDESPIVRKRLLDNLTISDALNDLFAGLALTGTNVNKENSS